MDGDIIAMSPAGLVGVTGLSASSQGWLEVDICRDILWIGCAHQDHRSEDGGKKSRRDVMRVGPIGIEMVSGAWSDVRH